MNPLRLSFFCIVLTTAGFAGTANDEAELSRRNRISLYTLWPYSLLRLGVEYERTLWIWGMVKPAIAPSMNLGHREEEVSEKKLRYEEHSSYFDLPFRISFLLESYFQVYLGAGISLYNIRVAISDYPGMNFGTTGYSNRAGVAPMFEVGFRYFYDAFSFGLSFGGANNALASTNYTYQSQSGIVAADFEEISSVSLRVSLVFSGLF